MYEITKETKDARTYQELLFDYSTVSSRLSDEIIKNEQLKDNWNKLKEYIVKEYYMYLPLDTTTNSITILIDKMQELEQGSDNNGR